MQKLYKCPVNRTHLNQKFRKTAGCGQQHGYLQCTAYSVYHRIYNFYLIFICFLENGLEFLFRIMYNTLQVDDSLTNKGLP